MADYKPKATFYEVLHNCDNQVVVRELISFWMLDHQKASVVAEFNSRMKAKHIAREQTEQK